jgi:hypothetical protein
MRPFSGNRSLQIPTPKALWQAVLIVNAIPETIGIAYVQSFRDIASIASYVLFCSTLIIMTWVIEKMVERTGKVS